jgi:hypothetical protein
MRSTQTHSPCNLRSTARWQRVLRRSLALAAVLTLALGASSTSWAQGNDDDLFGDEETFVDEFATAKELEGPQRGWRFWALSVPVDLLVLRPIAFADTAIGLMLYAGISQLQTVGVVLGAMYDWTIDGEWYVEQGGLDQAWQQLVGDPFMYLAERPIGELTSD